MDYNSRIIEIRKITDEIGIFRIKFDNGEKLRYKAGQFAVLGLPEDEADPDGQWHRRAYSIASAPSSDSVEFYIVLVEGGRFTSRLFKLAAGDRIYMGEKVAGMMSLDDVAEQSDVLFVCTGTGVSPFVSMLRHGRKELLGPNRRVALVQGARKPYELGFSAELSSLAKEFGNFHYFQMVSRADEDSDVQWTGRRGRVQSVLADGTIERLFGGTFNPEGLNVFICGNPNMVDEVSGFFKARGFEEKTALKSGSLYFDKH
jgi:ferredoxin--NADP+ reductase